jgi:exopolysaccharide production protein ExoQ
MLKNRAWPQIYAVLAFFTVLAGDAWRYSLSWYGWGAVIALISTVSIVLVVKQRTKWRWNGLPYPLLVFVALALVSTAWSAYPGFTILAAVLLALTVTASLALAVTFTLPEIVRLLGHALRLILGASVLFELVVSIFVRQPILPWWTNYSGKIPASYYWSRDLLFKGDRIQGILGNSNLLGFIALLAVIVFAIEFASRSMHRAWSAFWLIVALACIALTRSATVEVAGVVVLVVAIVLVLLRAARTVRTRRLIGGGAIVVILLGVVSGLVFRGLVERLLNKSGTLTGRTDIWGEVVKLALQRPAGGWGWISYWFPGIPPFKDNPHFVLHHVQYLQAHEAWLDVWFQLGIIGLIVFAALVLSTLVRSWILAVDRPQVGQFALKRFSPVTLLPVLLLVALLVQSLAESRLLIEYGMLLLAFIAIKTKRPDAPVVS